MELDSDIYFLAKNIFKVSKDKIFLEKINILKQIIPL